MRAAFTEFAGRGREYGDAARFFARLFAITFAAGLLASYGVIRDSMSDQVVASLMAVVALMWAFFSKMGFTPMQVPAKGTAPGALPPLEPGGPVAVSLIQGDFDFSAVGTVTHIDKDAVYAFGHPFFGIGLNPGHLIHLDEWVHSPIRKGSAMKLASGMALQCDIIPATGTAYFTSNIEDGIALAERHGMSVYAVLQRSVKAGVAALANPSAPDTTPHEIVTRPRCSRVERFISSLPMTARRM